MSSKQRKAEFWTWEGQTFSPHGYYTAAQGSGAMWAIERGGVMREGELRPDHRRAASERHGSRRRRCVDHVWSDGPDADCRRRSCGARCYEAYNDWLTDFCAAKPERLIGVAQLSMEDPQAARDELERLAKRGGLRHVNILASRANPPVYDEAWEPFWTLAEEVGIPIGFHLAVLVKKTRLDDGESRRAPILSIATASRFAQEPPGIQLLGTDHRAYLRRRARSPSAREDRDGRGRTCLGAEHDSGPRHLVSAHAATAAGSTGDGPITLPKMLPSEYFHRQIWISFVDDPLGVKMVGSVLDVRQE